MKLSIEQLRAEAERSQVADTFEAVYRTGLTLFAEYPDCLDLATVGAWCAVKGRHATRIARAMDRPRSWVYPRLRMVEQVLRRVHINPKSF